MSCSRALPRLLMDKGSSLRTILNYKRDSYVVPGPLANLIFTVAHKRGSGGSGTLIYTLLYYSSFRFIFHYTYTTLILYPIFPLWLSDFQKTSQSLCFSHARVQSLGPFFEQFGLEKFGVEASRCRVPLK